MTDTDQMHELKTLIDSSDRILITSHISPDPDAVSSVLLLGKTLEENFHDKQVIMVLEERPTREIGFLDGYESLKFGNLLELTKSFKPNLFIMVDVANVSRVSRDDSAEITELLKNDQSKVVIIDHHEPIGKDSSDLYINEHLPATAQQIFKTCFEELKLQKPDSYAETTLLGILTDTNRFKYQNPKHAETFKIVDELLDAGASIEKIENITERYDLEQVNVFTELLKNLSSEADYNFSFLDDEFMENWQRSGKPFDAIKNGSDLLINQFLRNYGDNYWGFVAYKEYLSGDDIYSARFRSIEDSKDVALLASKLGGGGHKGAAGAKFEAKSLDDAVSKVKQAIDNS